jgi:hypothetical protein
MQKSDAQLAIPAILYIDTKTNIEAIATPAEGMEAFANDTHEFGTYNGATWDWGIPHTYVAGDTVEDADGTIESATSQINLIIDRLQELGLIE